MMETSSLGSLSVLPSEIIDLIITHCTPASRFLLALTSRVFHSLIPFTPSIYEVFCEFCLSGDLRLLKIIPSTAQKFVFRRQKRSEKKIEPRESEERTEEERRERNEEKDEENVENRDLENRKETRESENEKKKREEKVQVLSVGGEETEGSGADEWSDSELEDDYDYPEEDEPYFEMEFQPLRCGAIGRHKDVILWLLEQDIEFSPDGAELAVVARDGDLDFCVWLLDQGCACSWTATIAACAGGHVHVFQYLFEYGYPIKYDYCAQVAAQFGHVHLLEYLNDLCSKYMLMHVLNKDTVLAAVEGGSLTTFKWFEEKLFPLTNKMYSLALRAAASYDRIEILKYIIEERGVIEPSIIYDAVFEESVEVLRYLLSRGIRWNLADLLEAQRGRFPPSDPEIANLLGFSDSEALFQAIFPLEGQDSEGEGDWQEEDDNRVDDPLLDNVDPVEGI